MANQSENISALYRQWSEVRTRGASGLTEAEAEALHAQYADLQARITSAVPVSASDLAIQLVVETEANESDWRPAFYGKVAALAAPADPLPTVPMAPATLVPTLDELAVEFERGLAAYHAANAACHADPENKGLDEVADAACNHLVDLCGQIGRLQPQTWDHVRLVARAMEWSVFPSGYEAGEDRLAFNLMRAVIDGVSR